jgi:hypothetical protein
VLGHVYHIGNAAEGYGSKFVATAGKPVALPYNQFICLPCCVLQSSSPSYILLSSLDAARAYAQQPDTCFGEALAAAQVGAVCANTTTPGYSCFFSLSVR